MKKIAIKIDNKRQFDALMKHYESKGWKWSSGKSSNSTPYSEIEYGNRLISYEDGFWQNLLLDNYTIIDFSTFSQLTGVEIVNEVKIDLHDTSARVTEAGVFFNGAVYQLDKMHLEEIYTAYKSLQS